MRPIMDVRDIIEALGGRERVAEATGSTIGTVTQWEWRGRFPAKKMMAVSALAAQQPQSGVTEQTIMALAASPLPRQSRREATAA